MRLDRAAVQRVLDDPTDSDAMVSMFDWAKHPLTYDYWQREYRNVLAGGAVSDAGLDELQDLIDDD